jgi:hypothetical protein
MDTLRPPVIIIGMHRSGTSMLARTLEQCGLFAGCRQDDNNESLFFQQLNCWIITRCGGEWDNPESIRWLLRNERIGELMRDYIGAYVDSPHLVGFLGLKKYLLYRSLANLDFPWGWKDPRNTFTLELWTRIFPEARVLHIHRHGVDVAHSLKARADSELDRSAAVYRRKKVLYNFATKTSGFTNSYRCLELEGGLSLWESYLRAAREHVRRLGERALEFSYEDFLRDPSPLLRKILPFCGIRADEEKIQCAAASLDASRAFAYTRVDRLKAFSDQMHDTLAQFGY